MKEKLVSWIGIVSALAPLQSALAVQWGELHELKEFVEVPPTSKQLPDGKSYTFSEPVANVRLLDSIQNLKVDKDNKKISFENFLDERPWSGDFWPDLKGSIADPYAETGNGWIKRINWNTSEKVLSGRRGLQAKAVNPATLNSIPQEEWDNMSPSEKYDLLVGDKNFTMTQRTYDMVKKLNQIDLTATFSGVCHGWSPASLSFPRPLHRATFNSAIGNRPIHFFPDDIKALSSFLWGKGPASDMVRFEGTKCYSGRRETKYGRMVDPKCFNVNPSFFHLVATNQIGLNRKGFVVDREAGAAVWNHPVYGFKYSYFSITDDKARAGKTLDQARVYRSSIDPNRRGTAFDFYHEFRSPKASSVVGVRMEFFYSREDMKPSHAEYRNDKSARDHDEWDSQVMMYDLELDAEDNIVGGEWRKYASPDARTLFGEEVDCTKFRVPFMSGTPLPCEKYTHPNSVWLVPPGVEAASVGDPWVKSSWDGTGAIPADWKEAAIKHASVATIGQADPNTGKLATVPAPQALGQIVKLLFKKSRD